MKEYSGAVFFIDVLGVSALTQGSIEITEADYIAHGFKYQEGFSEHQFCAKLLLKFRRILIKIMKRRRGLKVAQLSDCAFVWSNDVNLVIDAAREIMWESVLSGLLCRGGIAYGQIVEPDTVNMSLGKFICGSAVTNAAKLEASGKGARIFVDCEIPSRATQLSYNACIQKKIPTDGSYIDEFQWHLFSDALTSHPSINGSSSKAKLLDILNAVCMLKYSPKFRWNCTSHQGKLQVANTIDIISDVSSLTQNHQEFHFSCEYAIQDLDNRSNPKMKSIYELYKKIITNMKIQK